MFIPWGRIITAISLLAVFGAIAGGAGLVLAGMLICFLGFLLGPPSKPARQPDTRPSPPPPVDAERLTEARRGKNADPTRPSLEDWQGIITNLRQTGRL